MAFTGRATDSPGIFAGQPEDVSELITMISPTETPILDLIGDAGTAATRVLHEWLEESLAPNAVTVTGTTVGSLAGASADSWAIAGGYAAYLQDGAVLMNPITGEYIRITQVIAPNTIVVTRGFGGTTASSAGATDLWMVVATAQLDGRAVARDVSRPRPRSFNFTQIFMKDIIIAGTEEAVLHIGVPDEWDHQVRLRTRENLIDLERAVILGIWSGNSIGGANNVRTMKGVFSSIATNAQSYGSFSEANVNDMVSRAFLQGGTDLDVFMMGIAVKAQFDQLNNTRIRAITPDEKGHFSNRVETYENTYGVYRLALNRWVPPTRLAALATGRMEIAPLINRSFHAKQTAQVGDSMNGYVLGEYTFMLRNEPGMASAIFPSLGYTLITP